MVLQFRRTVGRRIRAERLKLNYTQEAVSDDIGVAHSTLSNWERGETPLTSDQLLRLSRYFNIPLSVLIADTPPPPQCH